MELLNANGSIGERLTAVFTAKIFLESSGSVYFKTGFLSLSSNMWFYHFPSINPSFCVAVSQDSFYCLLP